MPTVILPGGEAEEWCKSGRQLSSVAGGGGAGGVGADRNAISRYVSGNAQLAGVGRVICKRYANKYIQFDYDKFAASAVNSDQDRSVW